MKIVVGYLKLLKSADIFEKGINSGHFPLASRFGFFDKKIDNSACFWAQSLNYLLEDGSSIRINSRFFLFSLCFLIIFYFVYCSLSSTSFSSNSLIR